MNRIPHILLITILILTGCKDHQSYDPESAQSENIPIEFGVSSDLSVESKAPITTNTDAGFIAFADLTVSGSDPVSVFGDGGQVVTHNGSTWSYSPVRYWQVGSYFFAGVMPAADFYTAAFSTNDQGNKQVTLDFGKDENDLKKGYDLAGIQADLMASFAPVQMQNLASPSPVDFVFSHQLAWVVIEAASMDAGLGDDGIMINELKVYGNSPATEGDIVYTYNNGNITVDQTLVAPTDEENVYKTFTPAAGAAADKDWKLVKHGAEAPVYDTLVPELLVFPEECTFYIIVTYTEDGIKKTRKGFLAADWEAGKKYTYKLHLATDISFSVSVSGWGEENVSDGDSTDADDDIEII